MSLGSVDEPAWPIAAVERDTGLSKDLLRVWERRYGFPDPARDALGDRLYPLAQVQRLRLLKRLLDAGHRPGRVVPLPESALQALAAAGARGAETVDEAQAPAGAGSDPCGPLIELLRDGDLGGLRAALQTELSRLGVSAFVCGLVAPLNVAVGEAWSAGHIEVYEEHLYTEIVQALLRQAIAALPAPGAGARPRVLLTTLPGEPHGIGLLMAQAVLTLEGAHCLALGVQTPPSDLLRAVRALRVDLVALSATGCQPARALLAGLAGLRSLLPPEVGLWVGSRVPQLQRRAPEGVQVLTELAQIANALGDWRTRRPLATPDPGPST